MSLITETSLVNKKYPKCTQKRLDSLKRPYIGVVGGRGMRHTDENMLLKTITYE